MADLSKRWLIFFLVCAGGAVLLFPVLFGCGDITDGEVASLSVSPTSATIGVNKTAAFYAVAKDSSGKIVTTTVTWSVEGGIGSISSTGLFTAGAAEGAGKVVGTAGTVSGSASVTITTRGWIEGTVSASDSSVPSGLKVYLSDLPAYVDFTDTAGKYSIDNVPVGAHEIKTIETSIYYESSSEVTVGSGETVTKDIFVNVKPGIPTIPTVTTPTFF